MPDITGIQFYKGLSEKPPVIFTTAFDEYAIKAFEAHAVDYLMKPFGADPAKVVAIGLIWQILYPIILVSFGFVFVQAIRKKVPWLVALPFAWAPLAAHPPPAAHRAPSGPRRRRCRRGR